MQKSNKIDPISDMVLSSAGDSGFEMLLKSLLPFFILIVVVGMLLDHVIMGLMIESGFARPSSIFDAFLFAIFAVFLLFYFPRAGAKIENYMLGIRGERYVANILENARVQGYKVLHDIPLVYKNGRKFNIDHLLIGPHGIYAIETKAPRHEKGSEKYATYENGYLIAGARLKNDPIQESKQHANRFSEIISDRMGSRVVVNPVVLLAGWFVDNEIMTFIKDQRQVEVQNPKYFELTLNKRPVVYDRQEIDRIYTSVASFVKERIRAEFE